MNENGVDVSRNVNEGKIENGNVEPSLLGRIISFLETVIGGVGIIILVVVLIYLAILLMVSMSCGLDTECRRDCIDNVCDD